MNPKSDDNNALIKLILNMKYIVFLFSLILVSCGGVKQDYYLNDDGKVFADRKEAWVKKSWFEVNSENYPEFRFSESFLPPSPSELPQRNMPEIKASDIWKVKYNVLGHYIIVSENYLNRLCEEPGYFYIDCARSRDFGIWVTLKGEIVGGWEVMKGNLQVGFEALERLNPKTSTREKWKFRRLNKVNDN